MASAGDGGSGIGKGGGAGGAVREGGGKFGEIEAAQVAVYFKKLVSSYYLSVKLRILIRH